MFSTRLLNVATPLTAVTLIVLPAVNPPGPLATAIVTVEVSLVTTLPNASSTATCTAGLERLSGRPRRRRLLQHQLTGRGRADGDVARGGARSIAPSLTESV